MPLDLAVRVQDRSTRAGAPPRAATPAARPVGAPADARLVQRARDLALPPLARLRADRAVLQRFAWPKGKEPSKVKKDIVSINGWLAERNWPRDRTMTEWVARAQANEGVQESWTKLQAELNKKTPNATQAHRQLDVGAGRLKTHIESTYEAPLTQGESAEKTKSIDALIKAISPSDLGEVYTREAYKDLLVAKVLGNPRYLQSIKAKDPYVEHLQDDDAAPGGLNAKLIKERIDVIRAGGDLTASLKPGTDIGWEKWREDDCLFAAILKVLLKQGAPTEESDDERLAGLVADHFNVAHNVVDDPVILALMDRLNWPQTRRANWADFTANADTAAWHVLSVDVLASGKKGHVVVATYNATTTAWEIYDRQAIRLGRPPLVAAPHPNNPLDSWQVVESDAAGALRQALT